MLVNSAATMSTIRIESIRTFFITQKNKSYTQANLILGDILYQLTFDLETRRMPLTYSAAATSTSRVCNRETR